MKLYRVTNNEDYHSFVKGGRTEVVLIVLFQVTILKIHTQTRTLGTTTKNQTVPVRTALPLYTAATLGSSQYTYWLPCTKTYGSVLLSRTEFHSEVLGKGLKELKLTRMSITTVS